MTGDAAAQLSRRCLEAHLAGVPVQIGVARCWWRIERLEFPILDVGIEASRRTFPPGWLTLRVDASGYPDQAPTACPFDLEMDTVLPADRRPSGGRATLTFRTDWENGRALYLPCDRIALAGHPGWLATHADDLWSPTTGIVKLLHLVHTILTEADDASAADAA